MGRLLGPDGTATLGLSCVVCLIVCYSQMTSVDALVSYHGQRHGHSRPSTTVSPPSRGHGGRDGGGRHGRQRQRAGGRRIQ